MTSNLRFVFAEQGGHLTIRERVPSGQARSWVLGPQGEIVEDFAVVTRLLDSKTGQVVIAAAGLGANGTQAAGEFISRRDYLEDAFRAAPLASETDQATRFPVRRRDRRRRHC